MARYLLLRMPMPRIGASCQLESHHDSRPQKQQRQTGRLLRRRRSWLFGDTARSLSDTLIIRSSGGDVDLGQFFEVKVSRPASVAGALPITTKPRCGVVARIWANRLSFGSAPIYGWCVGRGLRPDSANAGGKLRITGRPSRYSSKWVSISPRSSRPPLLGYECT